MKVDTMILILALCCFSVGTFAQERVDTLDITFRKTTSIVFGYPIVNVDRGSSDVIAQKVKGAENMLQVKAASKGFRETNLTVITADGNLHHFYIHYADDPANQVYHVDSKESSIQLENRKSVVEFELITDLILKDRSAGFIVKDSKFKIRLAVKGIYIFEDILYYRLQIRNKSNMHYDVESLTFFIRDNKSIKRTASQEIQVNPIYISNGLNTVKGNSVVEVVFALPKFTIPDAKTLEIELFEKDGGRDLKIRIRNSAIVNAQALP